MMMEWLLHWNTGSLRKHKPSLPCSILLSTNYVTVKACSRNITGSTNLAYNEKANLQVPVRLSFQGLPSFLGKGKSTKCTYFVTGHCFIHPPLIFAVQSLIISLQIITFLESLFLIDGFSKPHRLDRNKNRGGVMIFIRDTISSKLLEKHIFPNDAERTFVELNFRKCKWLLCGTYHPPSQSDEYLLITLIRFLILIVGMIKFCLWGTLTQKCQNSA